MKKMPTKNGGVSSLIRLRRAGQITLASEIGKALRLREGDYLEASLVKGGVFLKPVMVVRRTVARKRKTR
jgi:bifunctional DNA-binding transcriptional regulator/antitoxin component of YhaV-PrlF toxin-antitoxin module